MYTYIQRKRERKREKKRNKKASGEIPCVRRQVHFLVTVGEAGFCLLYTFEL